MMDGLLWVAATAPSPLKELLFLILEVLIKFSLGVADPCVAAQRLGFETEPRLPRVRVAVVAQGLPRRGKADVARGGFGDPA